MRIAEPVIMLSPLPPAAKESQVIPVHQAGTFLCDLQLLTGGLARPLPALPPIVGESERRAVDRGEVFLIEVALYPGRKPIAPGIDPKGPKS
jgi:hypothetical protein